MSWQTILTSSPKGLKLQLRRGVVFKGLRRQLAETEAIGAAEMAAELRRANKQHKGGKR